MKNLLYHEFFKLKKNKTAYIVFLLSIAFSIFVAVIAIVMPEEIGGTITGSDGLSMAVDGNQLWFIMCAILVSSFVVTEYQRGIIRNTVMCGHQRYKIYLTKYIISLITAIVLFTTIVIINVIVASTANGWGDIGIGKFILMYLHVLLQYAAVIAVILLIADLTRSTGAALGANIGLIMLFSIIGSLGIKVIGPDGEVLTKGNKILEFIGDLYVGILSTRAATPDLTTIKIIQYICTAVCTFVAAFMGGVYLFNKRDLK